MTRKALIELVTRRFKYTDSKKQFSMPYVQGVLDQVWQQLCVTAYSTKLQDINYYAKLYRDVVVTEDISNQRWFCLLPEEIIRLPRIGDGVVSINQGDSRDADFKPLKESDFRLMTSQEVYRIGRDIYYYVKYNQIFFGSSMTSDIATAGVDISMCIPFSKYDLNEELPLPGGQSQLFIETAVNFLMGTPPVNTNNKNEV